MEGRMRGGEWPSEGRRRGGDDCWKAAGAGLCSSRASVEGWLFKDGQCVEALGTWLVVGPGHPRLCEPASA